MEFQSILFGSEEPDLLKETPEFFHDLQLDYLLEQILVQEKEYDTGRYFYTFPKTKELISYRQQIGKDMESEELCTIIRSFCRNLRESRKLYNLSLKSKGEVKSATYHLQAATLYWETLQRLEKELQRVTLVSDGMKAFAGFAGKELVMQRERGFEAAITQANRFFSELSFQLSMDSDKLTVVEREEETGKNAKKEKKELTTNYFEELCKLLGQEPEQNHLATKIDKRISASQSGLFPPRTY